MLSMGKAGGKAGASIDAGTSFAAEGCSGPRGRTLPLIMTNEVRISELLPIVQL